MSKGNAPRFTRRVHKDNLGIKAKAQKKKNLARNAVTKDRLRWANKIIEEHLILSSLFFATKTKFI